VQDDGVPELSVAGTTDVAELPDGLFVNAEDVWVVVDAGARSSGSTCRRRDRGVVPPGGRAARRRRGRGVGVGDPAGGAHRLAARPLDRRVQATIDVPDQPGGITAGRVPSG
jgi:hypothetical protein